MKHVSVKRPEALIKRENKERVGSHTIRFLHYQKLEIKKIAVSSLQLTKSILFQILSARLNKNNILKQLNILNYDS